MKSVRIRPLLANLVTNDDFGLAVWYRTHKTLVDSELQENWWRKFWRLITLIIVNY